MGSQDVQNRPTVTQASLTRMECKEDNIKFVKCKVRLVVRGDQQIAGVSFNKTDLYALQGDEYRHTASIWRHDCVCQASRLVARTNARRTLPLAPEASTETSKQPDNSEVNDPRQNDNAYFLTMSF